MRREVMVVCRVDLRGRQCVFRLFNPKINDQTTSSVLQPRAQQSIKTKGCDGTWRPALSTVQVSFTELSEGFWPPPYSAFDHSMSIIQICCPDSLVLAAVDTHQTLDGAMEVGLVPIWAVVGFTSRALIGWIHSRHLHLLCNLSCYHVSTWPMGKRGHIQ